MPPSRAESSWTASHRGSAARRRGAGGAPSKRAIRWGPLGGADRFARSRFRRGRCRVLELLLGAEQGVEDLLAETLAQGKGQTRANEPDEEHAAATPLLPLPAQGVGRLA